MTRFLCVLTAMTLPLFAAGTMVGSPVPTKVTSISELMSASVDGQGLTLTAWSCVGQPHALELTDGLLPAGCWSAVEVDGLIRIDGVDPDGRSFTLDLALEAPLEATPTPGEPLTLALIWSRWPWHDGAGVRLLDATDTPYGVLSFK